MEEKTVAPAVQPTPVTPPSEKVTTPTQENPPKEVKPTETPEIDKDPEAGKADPLLDGYYKSNPFFYEVASYFDVKPENQAEAAPKLSVVVDWIVEKYNVHTPEDILLKLRQTEELVQKPEFGQERYSNLYKYARLAAQHRSTEKAMQAFQRDPNAKW